MINKNKTFLTRLKEERNILLDKESKGSLSKIEEVQLVEITENIKELEKRGAI